MSSPDVGEVARPDDPHVVTGEVVDAGVEIVDLVDGHVAAVAATAIEQPASGGALLDRRDHLQELVTDHHQGIVQAELAHAGIVEADREAERIAQFGHHVVEVVGHEGHLAKSDHGLSLADGRRGPTLGRCHATHRSDPGPGTA